MEQELRGQQSIKARRKIPAAQEAEVTLTFQSDGTNTVSLHHSWLYTDTPNVRIDAQNVNTVRKFSDRSCTSCQFPSSLVFMP